MVLTCIVTLVDVIVMFFSFLLLLLITRQAAQLVCLECKSQNTLQSIS